MAVDGQTGTVFELEESVEAPEDDDDDGEKRLALTVIEGEPAPGEEITLRVTDSRGPVANAAVELNEAAVGETDANGIISVTLSSEEADIEVTAGDVDGEREFEFDDEESSDAGDDDSRSDDDSEADGEEEDDDED